MRELGGDGNVLCLVLGNGTWVYTVARMHQTEHLRTMHLVICILFVQLIVTEFFLLP